MDDRQNIFSGLFTWRLISLLSFLIFTSFIIYSDYFTSINIKILYETAYRFFYPTIYSSTIENLVYQLPSQYLTLFIFLSISVSSLFVLKFQHPLSIIILSFLYFTGDFITPLLISLAFIFGGGLITRMFQAVLFIHEPLYLIPSIIRNFREGESLSKTLVLIVSLFILLSVSLERYLSFISNLSPLYILYLIFALIAFLLYHRYEGLISLLGLFSPSAVGTSLFVKDEVRDDWVKETYIFSVAFLILLLSPMLVSNPVIPDFNPGLDNFISNYVPYGETILVLSDDPNIIRVLIDNGYYVVKYDDALKWNWSDRDFIRDRLEAALEYAENHGIKYVLLDKPPELAYWISPKIYKEYKYPLREPLDRYIVILERNGVIPTAKGFLYLDDVSGEYGNIVDSYIKLWSNVSVKVEIEDGFISIRGEEPYEVYLHFRPDTLYGNYLIKLDGEDSFYQSLEIYGFNGRLESKWVLYDRNVSNPLFIELNDMSQYQDVVLKIEDDGRNDIWLYKIDGELYNVEVVDEYLRIASQTNLTISIKEINGEISLEVPPGREEYISIAGGVFEYMEFLFLPLLVFGVETSKYKIRKYVDTIRVEWFLLTGVSTPIILYLILHPRMLEISWIGGGVFLIALSMTLFYLTVERKNIQEINMTNLFLATYAGLILIHYAKLFYGDSFDLLGDFWRNQSLYTAIDVLILGFIFLITILISIKENRRIYAIPLAYLALNGVIFITDLYRVYNPIFQVLIDSATFLVDLSMELIGYRIEYVTVPAGNALYLYDERLLTIVILGWPCTGITGLFLFGAFHSILNIYSLERYGRGIPRHIAIVGLIITYLLNIVRIDVILYLDVYYGVDASELFHSTIYEFIFLLWIGIYLLIVYKMYFRRWS